MLQGAFYWARKLYGENATIFGWLWEGEMFRFPGSPEAVYEKRRRGWYRSLKTGRSYRTSAGTAVFKVEPEA